MSETMCLNTYLRYDNDKCRWCGKTLQYNNHGWACSDMCRINANEKEKRMESLTEGKTYKDWSRAEEKAGY